MPALLPVARVVLVAEQKVAPQDLKVSREAEAAEAAPAASVAAPLFSSLPVAAVAEAAEDSEA